MFGLFSSNTAYKALKFDYQVLKEQLDDAQHEAYSWKRAAEAAKADCDTWRAKFELSQLNPEVKADTEAAFKRGMSHSKSILLNNLRTWMDQVQYEKTETPKDGTN